MGTDTRSQPLPFGEKPELDLRAFACALDIVPVAKEEAPRIEQVGSGADLPIAVARTSTAVEVRVAPPEAGWLTFLNSGGPSLLRLHLPPNIRAQIRNELGVVKAERLEGCDLSITTSAGVIQLREIRGRMVLRAEAGQIRGIGLGGSFNVESSAGAVRLGIVALDPGTHRIHSSMGSVRLDLAAGLRVRIAPRTSMGSVRNRYPSSPDADAVLEAEAELGSVRIDEAAAHDDPRHGDWDDWRKHWADDRHKDWDWRKFWSGQQPGWSDWSEFVHKNVIPRIIMANRAARRRTAAAATRGGDASVQPPAPSDVGDDELKRILKMVQEGTISAEEAEKLIRAMEGR